MVYDLINIIIAFLFFGVVVATIIGIFYRALFGAFLFVEDFRLSPRGWARKTTFQVFMLLLSVFFLSQARGALSFNIVPNLLAQTLVVSFAISIGLVGFTTLYSKLFDEESEEKEPKRENSKQSEAEA